MKKYNLVPKYTVAEYKPHKTDYNNGDIPNIVDGKFNGREDLEVIVSDLTYVRVGYA